MNLPNLVCRRTALVVAALLLAPPAAWAQNPQPAPPPEETDRSRVGVASGRIVGRAVDATTGEALSNVAVSVLGTGAAALSGVDGRFVIVAVPAGSNTLRAENLGYAPKQVTDVRVPAGGVVEQDITLAPQAVQLGAINVTAAAERGSISRALDAQRNATGILNAVTAEQMGRSPDGDAAAALQRVSGVTVQEGKFVFVRGLGERYTTTSLNGARIPSPEPERKQVPLDLFPSGLLQTITTSKTFTPDLSGDFSGAQVDIQTREFPGARQLTYSLGVGVNDRATGRAVLAAPAEGREWLGFGGRARALPAGLAAAGNFQGGQVTPDDMNGFARSLRNAWTPGLQNGRPNGSLGFSIGGTDPWFGQRFSYLASGTYANTQEVLSEQVRAQARPGSTVGTTEETDRFTGSTGRNAVLWGGLANLSTLLGEHSRLALNATYNRSADAEGRLETGRSENYGQLPMRVLRQRFVERAVLSAQLKGEHQPGAAHRADWAVTYSAVSRNEPDRSEFVYAMPEDEHGQPGAPQWFSAATEGAVRTFAELSENNFEAAANYRLALGTGAGSWLKAGALFRATDRAAGSRAYGISATQLSRELREQSPEEIFGAVRPGDQFTITPMAQGGAYTASDRVLAGYAMAELRPTPRLRVVGGARLERSAVEVAAEPTLGDVVTARPAYTDVLPSLSLTYELTGSQNLRLSAAQTLARPEYREIAEIQYREVLGSDVVRGNALLERTLIRNYDARWEWYPDAGEVVSLGVFAKAFDRPIERMYLGTSGTRVVTFVNAEAAHNYGVELELRKRLDLLGAPLAPFTAFLNATAMKSAIELPSDGVEQTDDSRAMVGQAPYVVNAGLTYASASGARAATLLYNVVGEKIYSAAEAPLPEVQEQARHNLDLSLRLALSGSLAAKLDARNLLDAPFELRQGSVVREAYRTGRVFSVGLSWTR
jgi:hypothetical protein